MTDKSHYLNKVGEVNSLFLMSRLYWLHLRASQRKRRQGLGVVTLKTLMWVEKLTIYAGNNACRSFLKEIVVASHLLQAKNIWRNAEFQVPVKSNKTWSHESLHILKLQCLLEHRHSHMLLHVEIYFFRGTRHSAIKRSHYLKLIN